MTSHGARPRRDAQKQGNLEEPGDVTDALHMLHNYGQYRTGSKEVVAAHVQQKDYGAATKESLAI